MSDITPAKLSVGARRRLVVSILVGAVGTAFEAYAVLTAMPLAASQLGRTDLYAWVFTMFVTGQVLAIVLAGRIADRRGPVLALVGGLILFALGLMAAGFAPNLWFLLVCRFVQGFGAGAINLSLMVLIAEVFDETERPNMIMALSFAWIGPSFFGPPLSAWIAVTLGWHWVFWSTLPLILVAAALGFRPMVKVQTAIGRNVVAASCVPLWAAIMAAMGAAVVQFATQQLDPKGDAAASMSFVTIAGIGAAGLMLLAFSVPRLMPPGTLRLRPGLPAVMWVRATQAGSFFIVESFLPLILVQQRDYTLLKAGFSLTLGAIGWTFGSWLQARAWLPLRRDQIIIVGAVQSMIGAALMLVFTTSLQISVVVAFLGYVVTGIGMGMSITSTSLATMVLSDSVELGRNTSSLQVSEGLGTALLVGVAGAVFAALRERQSLEVTFSAMLGVALIAGLVSIGIAFRIGPVRNEVREQR